MRDDKPDQDFIVINLNDRFEVQYWSKKFGVTHDALIRAVNEVGHCAKAVQVRLQR